MKCPNCASEVPDASNFCGVCGFDVRAARAAAESMNQTVAIDSPARASDEAVSAETLHDSAPNIAAEAEAPVKEPAPAKKAAPAPDPEPKSEPVQTAEKAEQPSRDIAPAPAIQSTSFDLKVSAVPTPSAQPGSAPSSPHETFASMPALDPPPPGKFRETQWFMAAQDPDHIDNIGNVVLDDLEENYKPGDSNLDVQVRQKFSLNVENAGGVSGGEPAQSSAGSSGNKGILIAVGVLVLAGIAYFVFAG